MSNTERRQAIDRVLYFATVWRLQRNNQDIGMIPDSHNTVVSLEIEDLERVIEYYHNALNEVTITTNEEGQCVAVTRTNEEHQILEVLWEAPKAPLSLPRAGEDWQHHKGGVYTVLLLTSEPGEDKADKFPRSVVYQGEDGRVWTRTLESWYESFKPYTL
jgi:hypothetical protein